MKLRKWFINTSLLVVVAAPVVTMVSCRDESQKLLSDQIAVDKIEQYISILWKGSLTSPHYTRADEGGKEKTFIYDETEKPYHREEFVRETGLDPFSDLTDEFLDNVKITYWIELGALVQANQQTFIVSFKLVRGRSVTILTRQIKVYKNEKDKVFADFIMKNERNIREGFAYGRNGFDITRAFSKYEPKPNSMHNEIPYNEFTKLIPLKGTLPSGYTMKIFIHNPITQEIENPSINDSKLGYAYPVQFNFYSKYTSSSTNTVLNVRVAKLATFFYSTEIEKRSTTTGLTIGEYIGNDNTTAKLLKKIAQLTYSDNVITNVAVPDLVANETVTTPMIKFNLNPLFVSTFGLRMRYIYDSSKPINETNKGEVSEVNMKFKVDKEQITEEHPFKINFDPNADIDLYDAQSTFVYEAFLKRFGDLETIQRTFVSMLNAEGTPGIEDGLDDFYYQTTGSTPEGGPKKTIPIDQLIRRTKLNEVVQDEYKTVVLPTYDSSFANVSFMVDYFKDTPEIGEEPDPDAHLGIVGKKYRFTIIVSREYIADRTIEFTVTSRDYLPKKT